AVGDVDLLLSQPRGQQLRLLAAEVAERLIHLSLEAQRGVEPSLPVPAQQQPAGGDADLHSSCAKAATRRRFSSGVRTAMRTYSGRPNDVQSRTRQPRASSLRRTSAAS